MNVLVSIHSPFEVWNIPRKNFAALVADFPQHAFRLATSGDETEAFIRDADVAFSSQIGPEHLRVAPDLRWIHSPSAGIGSMLFPEMIASPVIITNSRGLAAETMAEHVLAVTLAFFRRLPLAMRRQYEHAWAQDEVCNPPGNRLIAGSRILLIGLGAIGSAVARRMAALGAHVIAVRRNLGAVVADGVSEVVPRDRLHACLPSADVVVICAPHTRETHGIFGAAELGRMSRQSILVNVSRGQLVDENALLEALRAGSIAGAALDVFSHEPLAPESPFWDLPNLLITPHTSGFRPDHWEAAVSLFVENLRRFETGRPLLNVVDKSAGY